MPLDFLTSEHKFFTENSRLIYSEKNTKKFIAHNNNKNIRACSQSSKRPVCMCIVNQTTGGINGKKIE